MRFLAQLLVLIQVLAPVAGALPSAFAGVAEDRLEAARNLVINNASAIADTIRAKARERGHTVTVTAESVRRAARSAEVVPDMMAMSRGNPMCPPDGCGAVTYRNDEGQVGIGMDAGTAAMNSPDALSVLLAHEVAHAVAAENGITDDAVVHEWTCAMNAGCGRHEPGLGDVAAVGAPGSPHGGHSHDGDAAPPPAGRGSGRGPNPSSGSRGI